MDAKVKIQDAFKGKDEIECRYQPKFPVAAEREYIRLTREYMKLLKESIEETLPEMKQIMWQDFRMDSKATDDERKKQRVEGFPQMAEKTEKLFARIKEVFENKVALFDIARRMRSISNKTRLITVKEWKKAIGKALGIDIFEDYYLGNFYEEQLEQWIEDNVHLITSIPREALSEMKQVVFEGYVQGKSVTEITRKIQDRYQVNKSKAKLLARDQIGKLNANITKHQQTDAGVRKYVWRTVGDSRVRKSHRELDGKTFFWSQPPVVDKRTGRRCHPGEDYQCRCIALSVFERNNINLPV